MFRIGNVQGITKYLLLGVLTLSSECLAAVNRVQYLEDGDDTRFFNPRRPNWEWELRIFSTTTQSPPRETLVLDGKTIFLIVLFVLFPTIYFGIKVFFWLWTEHLHYENKAPGSSVVSRPRRLVSPPPTAINSSSGNSRQQLAFYNITYQPDSSTVDSRPVDMPPDYSTSMFSDLATKEKYNPPTIAPKLDTPPPKY